MTVTLRQHKTAESNSSGQTSWSATFDSVPLAGSLLVAVLGYQGFGGSVKQSAVTGFTMVRPAVAGSLALAGAGKLAGASESATVTAQLLESQTTDSSSLVIAEFEGDFNADSVSSATSAIDFFSSGTAFNTRACPALNVEGTQLVVPMLGVTSVQTSPSANLDHTLIAHSRPGTESWARACAAARREVVDDSSHQPTWSWTTTTSVVATAQMAFPVDVDPPAPSAIVLDGAQAASVSLSWNDNSGGPFKVLRDSVEVASGLTGTSYLDSSVTLGQEYSYQIEDASEVLSNAKVVTVSAQGGVFYLRRTATGWSSDGS